MCGIAGIVELKSSPQPNLIQQMTNQLTHRGPDHGDSVSYPFQEYWMGLGHRRLSVIDLSSQANQPMEYNALTIVFNGEIYNFKALRQTLEQLGHSFKTSSDTEVLLHAFRAWGKEMIQRLNGMFAIAIFDKESGDFITKFFYPEATDDVIGYMPGKDLESLVSKVLKDKDFQVR